MFKAEGARVRIPNAILPAVNLAEREKLVD